jgi:hypothetical protein
VPFSVNASPQTRTVATRISKIKGLHGPDDPRLEELEQQHQALRAADDLRAWAERNAAALPPLDADEVAAIAAIASRIDRKLGIGQKAASA